MRILGLGGCRKYHPGSFQYTDRQMRGRILKMRWPIRKAGGVDILVTHAPAEGLGDSEDVAHWGFPSLRTFLDKYSPGYHVHGHVCKIKEGNALCLKASPRKPLIFSGAFA